MEIKREVGGGKSLGNEARCRVIQGTRETGCFCIPLIFSHWAFVFVQSSRVFGLASHCIL